MLGRYRLVERLGSGGFGVVWRAQDVHLEREVAVKAIARSGAQGRAADRTEREARAAARLNHPGIVALYEMGADAEAVYLVSELVHGRALSELERGGALSDRDVGRIGIALADALAHAHERGVIHRDVKPQNVIVVAEPAAGAGFAKLTDFGVAHLVGDDALTRTGDVVGTLAYMAPEQAEGRSPTAACDVYALGLTLFEAFAGENPMRGRNPAETARLVGLRPPPLRDYRRDLPPELCRVLDACLDPRPERRPRLGGLHDSLARSSQGLAAGGGLVEPETLARYGLRRRGDPLEEPPPRAAVERPLVPPAEPALVPRAAPRGEPRGYERPPLRRSSPDAPGGRPSGRGLATRAAAGLALGGAALATLALVPGSLPVAPLAAAAVVAAATALLPRIGWLLTVGALLAWLVLVAGLDGAALVALAVLLPTPLLLPRAGTAWSLPALAPLLGAIGLAPAYLGLAGLAATPARRLGLGAAGGLWVSAAEVLSGETLLLGPPASAPSPGAWVGSLLGALTDALPSLLSLETLVAVLGGALFALVLPLAVRGRALGLDLARGLVWALGLVAVLVAATDLPGMGDGSSGARGAVLGPIAGLAAALLLTGLRGGRSEPLPEAGERLRSDAVRRSPVA